MSAVTSPFQCGVSPTIGLQRWELKTRLRYHMSLGCTLRYWVQRYLVRPVPGSSIRLGLREIEGAVKREGAACSTKPPFSKPIRP